MCLSTVYKNKLTPETVMMRNVMKIECRDGMVILTDLMERQMAVEGTLEMANLVDGVAVVKRIFPHDFSPGWRSRPGEFSYIPPPFGEATSKR